MEEEQHWSDDVERLYSDRDSDDSPLLSQRFRRQVEYPPAKVEEREKRSTLTILTKFFLFCTAMILFCVLMYIPVYNKANDQVSKGFVAGWPMHTNRDTKTYIRPNNITTIHEPKAACPKTADGKLFLLIVVCSATEEFERRRAIRETWGNRSGYALLAAVNRAVKAKYSNYNFTFDLYSENETRRVKRDLSVFNRLLPALAEAMRESTAGPEEGGGSAEGGGPEAGVADEDAPEELTEPSYDYYDTNVMKIAPRGAAASPDLAQLLKMLKHNKVFPKAENLKVEERPEFRVVFLLGLPNKNYTGIQNKIDREAEQYGDIIQEDFIDTYNNLTLKSIMLLKWINNNCNNTVQYVLKTDDDMYINVVNLIDALKNKSKEFHEKRGPGAKEYLLMGSRISGSKPVQDTKDKWFSPRYMYQGRVYPPYLSGTAYVFSFRAAGALYEAALRTPYFHLEDIYITGMCAERARPRLARANSALFQYVGVSRNAAPCAAHSLAALHRAAPRTLRYVTAQLAKTPVVDQCERKLLTKIRQRQRLLYVLYKFLGLVNPRDYYE